ncbi:Bax inhibitor-1/YccA family protein [Listeria booriae]|uniref:Bax inhibitor-1/YccA family protein n=1 Tax=Listeria booriae TaxID=1552123 RepID=A0A7X1A880_9LIST|nr:Bax inhibitor-1/YccA family protein [Listeria booriae]MBC2373072.1 Bax inhibitor-1/YccA family protein [Listeria booriae]
MNETYRSAEHATAGATKAEIMQKVLNWFVISLVMATVGTVVGREIPFAFYIPLVVLEFALLIAMIFVRRSKSVSKIGYGLLLAFAFVTGLVLAPTLQYYLNAGAGNAVLMAFATATVTFTVLGFVGAKMKTDLSFMAKGLFAALLIVVVISLISIFFPLSSLMSTIFAGAGTLLFSLYILFDFNQIMKRDVTMKDVPLLAMSLYLDFLNLFLFLLRLFAGRN